jgi:hypothetical protein
MNAWGRAGPDPHVYRGWSSPRQRPTDNGRDIREWLCIRLEYIVPPMYMATHLTRLYCPHLCA